jgi:hypothetical protein
MWERARFADPWSLLGTVTIVLLMLAIPLSHMAWLVLAAIWLSHSTGPQRADEKLTCPHCAAGIRPDWNVCPYCGGELKGMSNRKKGEAA